jgi:hypothetical protein
LIFFWRSSDQDWQQKFAIVGGKSFVIPSLKLDYFDKKTQTKKTKLVSPLPIFCVKYSSEIN